MPRRLLLRVLLFFPSVFCAAAWAWSGAYTEFLGYQNSKGEWDVELAPNELVFWSSSPNTAHLKPGWNYWHTRPDWAIGEIYTGLEDWHFAGLHYFSGNHPYARGTSVLIVLPLWFLTGLSLTTVVLAFLLTRKKKGTRAFPVLLESSR